MATSPKTISVEGVTLTLVVERKNVKNVNARLRGSILSVSLPLRMPQTEADQAIIELARRLVRRVHFRQINSAKDASALAQQLADRFPDPPAVGQVFFVTNQRARWGSYSTATGTIRLHAALRRMPRWVLEAVMAHELTHVVYPDHSPDFWSLLRSVCPQTDRAIAFLAGVSWLGSSWSTLPETERALLRGDTGWDEGAGG